MQAPDQYSIEVDRGRRILTLFRGGTRVAYFSVAVGKPATPTPLGTFRIRNKAVNPVGPFGTRWLGLTANGIGIHGTNAPSSIGLAVSNGCVRMYNQDVEYIFPLVNVSTPVRIIRGTEATAPTRTYTGQPGDSLCTSLPSASGPPFPNCAP
ncbi:MAG: L,D-transpeptidase [Clostridia bacterium]|nr:L,D-transpeptidase [Clostridia bacterium]